LCIIKKTVLEDVSILYESLNESKSSIFLPKDSKIFDSYKDSYRNRKNKFPLFSDYLYKSIHIEIRGERLHPTSV